MWTKVLPFVVGTTVGILGKIVYDDNKASRPLDGDSGCDSNCSKNVATSAIIGGLVVLLGSYLEDRRIPRWPHWGAPF